MAKGQDPAFLFYPNDWIGGTMGMTFEEKGAYMELLMLQFNRGHMTKHMIGQTVGQLFGRIEDKFVLDKEGRYYNERLEYEKQKREDFTKSRRNNILGVNQHNKNKENKEGHMTSHMSHHMVNVNNIYKEGSNIIDSNNNKNKNDEEKKELHPLQKAIKEKLPTVSKLKTQLTEKDCERLVDEFDKNVIWEILEAMENKADLLKKYSSVNLTIRSWIAIRREKELEKATIGVEYTTNNQIKQG
jgi:hypothetical protein